MDVLLDTHALIWFYDGTVIPSTGSWPYKLSPKT